MNHALAIVSVILLAGVMIWIFSDTFTNTGHPIVPSVTPGTGNPHPARAAVPTAQPIVVASAPFANDPSGVAPYESGHAMAYDGTGTLLWDRYGMTAPSQYMGWSLAAGGDPNQDGYTDVIAGSPWFAGTRGRVDLFSGLSGSSLCGANAPAGTLNNTFFGASVSGGGRMNTDLIPDYVIGAPLQDTVSVGQNVGRVYSMSGNTCVFNFTDSGQNTDDHYGKTVLTGAGMDLDGDALDDYIAQGILFGPPQSRIGDVYAISSNPTSSNRVLWHVRGGTNPPVTGNGESYFGHSLAMIGDVDADYVMDFAVGGPSGIIAGTQGQTGTGWVSIVSGASGAKMSRTPGENPQDLFGFSVAGLGDNDHDGKMEIAVGAEGYVSAFQKGKVYAYEVDSSGTLTPLWTKLGENNDDGFGFSLASAKDLDGDGVNELVVGAPFFDGAAGANSGKIYVLDALTGNVKWTKEGPTSGGNNGYQFGYAVAATPVFG